MDAKTEMLLRVGEHIYRGFIHGAWTCGAPMENGVCSVEDCAVSDPHAD